MSAQVNESRSINLSLFHLRTMIESLSKGQLKGASAQARSSKLTEALTPVMSGNCMVRSPLPPPPPLRALGQRVFTPTCEHSAMHYLCMPSRGCFVVCMSTRHDRNQIALVAEWGPDEVIAE